VNEATKLQLHFLTSALVGGEWLASCPDCFTPGQKPLVSTSKKSKDLNYMSIEA